MYRHTVLGTAAFALMLAAAPAMAQTTERDVRCFIVSQTFSKTEKDPARRQLAAAAGLFYFGRVDAQTSGAALRSQFITQLSVLQKLNAGQEMSACAKDFIAHQHNMQTSVQGVMAGPTKK